MITSEVKVVFLGESTVGKTSIIASYSKFGFPTDTTSTIGASFSLHRVQMASTEVKLKIWDTAGQERFRSLTPMYYRDAHVAVLVFAVDSPESFVRLDTWIEDLRREVNKVPAVIVAGNKIDLPRRIDREQCEAFAQRIGASYCECSAKTRAGIDELFQMAASFSLEGFNFMQDEPLTAVPLKEPDGGCC
jgi:small GTP-binding protein